MRNLPDKLYQVKSVVRLEQLAINEYGISAYELMKRAGAAVFDVIKNRYPQCKVILVLCGAGNNAGDGYVLAKLAKQEGYSVRLISLIDPQTLKHEALLAYEDWLQVGENDTADFSKIDQSELVVDALLGTGLTRQVSAEWADWITAVNRSANKVISVDIPSGLFADTGVIAGGANGVAIKADATVTFIGLKQGMFTAQARDVCGEIIYLDLGLPEAVYSHVECDALLLSGVDQKLLPARKASSHKGCFGHVLIAGGNNGMPGAIILAARAALRTGAGLVTILTIPQHLAAISSAVPEAMVKTCTSEPGLVDGVMSISALFEAGFAAPVTHVAIGMGLGRDEWSSQVLQHCLHLNKPILLDADALNLVAGNSLVISQQLSSTPVIITPHPGEAARLLASPLTAVTTADIQNDRFDTVRKLHALFQHSMSCCVVLKGSGSLIYDGDMIKVCGLGSAAMAAPGMGDVLSGIIIAALAQVQDDDRVEVSEIVSLAVCLHASAAERAIGDKTRGLLATDVIDCLPRVLQ